VYVRLFRSFALVTFLLDYLRGFRYVSAIHHELDRQTNHVAARHKLLGGACARLGVCVCAWLGALVVGVDARKKMRRRAQCEQDLSRGSILKLKKRFLHPSRCHRSPVLKISHPLIMGSHISETQKGTSLSASFKPSCAKICRRV